MEREIYMSNLPDLNQLLHNKKKKIRCCSFVTPE